MWERYSESWICWTVERVRSSRWRGSSREAGEGGSGE